MKDKIQMRTQLFAILVLFSLTGHYLAQDNSSKVFSEFTVGAGYTSHISIGDLDEYWKSGNAASLSISTPFYFGTVGIGVDATAFESKAEGRPDFNTLFFNMSWMQGIRILGISRLSAGIKVGSYNMLFKDNKLTEFESNESELAAAATAKYDIDIYNGFSFHLNPEFITVFTNKRLKLFNITAGLSYTFNSPQWIKDILE